MFKSRLRFHWILFQRVQLIISQHWFRLCLGADQATSHYLNQWRLVYWRIYASLGPNELKCKLYSVPLSLDMGTITAVRVQIPTKHAIVAKELFFMTCCEQVCTPLLIYCRTLSNHISGTMKAMIFLVVTMATMASVSIVSSYLITISGEFLQSFNHVLYFQTMGVCIHLPYITLLLFVQLPRKYGKYPQ